MAAVMSKKAMSVAFTNPMATTMVAGAMAIVWVRRAAAPAAGGVAAATGEGVERHRYRAAGAAAGVMGAAVEEATAAVITRPSAAPQR